MGREYVRFCRMVGPAAGISTGTRGRLAEQQGGTRDRDQGSSPKPYFSARSIQARMSARRATPAC